MGSRSAKQPDVFEVAARSHTGNDEISFTKLEVHVLPFQKKLAIVGVSQRSEG